MCGCIWDELDVGLLHLGVNAWEAHAFLGYCIWVCVCGMHMADYAFWLGVGV